MSGLIFSRGCSVVRPRDVITRCSENMPEPRSLVWVYEPPGVDPLKIGSAKVACIAPPAAVSLVGRGMIKCLFEPCLWIALCFQLRGIETCPIGLLGRKDSCACPSKGRAVHRTLTQQLAHASLHHGGEVFLSFCTQC